MAYFSDLQALGAHFRSMLGQPLPEQDYQEFLEENPCLIPREFIMNHGLMYSLVLRKLSLGDYTCDFFYLSKSSAHWNCIFVEIERPGSKFFKEGKNDQFHGDFNKAINQIDTWRAYLSSTPNQAQLTDHVLGPLRRPWSYNPCSFKFVLVMGRRAEYESNEQRTRMLATKRRDDLAIMSYDGLLERLEQKPDLYIGTRHNDGIHILSHRFVDDYMFVWVEPQSLRISQPLKDSILANKARWRSMSTVSRYKLDEVLPKIKIVSADLRFSNRADALPILASQNPIEIAYVEAVQSLGATCRSDGAALHFSIEGKTCRGGIRDNELFVEAEAGKIQASADPSTLHDYIEAAQILNDARLSEADGVLCARSILPTSSLDKIVQSIRDCITLASSPDAIEILNLGFVD